MKAAVHTRYGPPDVVRVSDVDTPVVKDHDVLIKVHATTVNRTDCGFRAGKPTAEDFTKDEQTYDVVFDAVGKSSFGRCKRLLQLRGIYLSSDLGPLSQNPFLALITPLFGGKKVMFPIPPKRDREGVRQFRDLIEAGTFAPVIDRRYPLDQIVEAYRCVQTGQKIGNVVISVDPGV